MTTTEPLSSSSSTYGAILVNPAAARPLSNGHLGVSHPNGSNASLISPRTGDRAASNPNLVFAYPLILAAILDAAYLTYHAATTPFADGGGEGRSPSTLLAGLTGLRVLVLMVCGLSRRWRSRGGWIAAACGISVGLLIWKDCVDQLTGDKKGRRKGDSVFLYTTILVALSEYLLFLILLRLSPPLYLIRPFSLLHPPGATQQPVPFAYSTQDAMVTPRSARYRRYSSITTSPISPAPARLHHRSRLSTNTFAAIQGIDYRTADMLGTGSYDTRSASTAAAAAPDVSSHSSQTDLEEQGYDYDDGSDYDYDCDSASSISESSIIDLPPPLEPHRIIAPSISMRSNLAHALDNSPLLGPIVRRTRSVQLLGRSFGSVMQDEMATAGVDAGSEVGMERETREGRIVAESDYGTFPN